MRSIAALLTVPLLIVSVAACGSDSEEEAAQGGIPAVSGAGSKEPQIAKGQGDPPGELKVKVLKEGDGPELRKGDALTADYRGQLWNGKVFDSSWKRGQAATFEIGTGKVIKGWDEGLVGQKLGSRVELVVPPNKGYGSQARGETIPANSTLVFVVDLKGVTPNAPEGKEVPQQDASLPKVGTNADGKAPEITIPKNADEPTEIAAEPIIQGTGKPVGKNQSVKAHFAVLKWKDGQELNNTWEQGSITDIPLSQLPGGKELVGQRVGSRVLLVVPESELSEEERKQFGSPLVFVVDILGPSES